MCRDGYVLMVRKNDSVTTVLQQSVGQSSPGGIVFVFLKLPPAACTIPGYKINLRQCHDNYNRMETSIKIIHDKHFTTRSCLRDTFATVTAIF